MFSKVLFAVSIAVIVLLLTTISFFVSPAYAHHSDQIECEITVGSEDKELFLNPMWYPMVDDEGDIIYFCDILDSYSTADLMYQMYLKSNDVPLGGEKVLKIPYDEESGMYLNTEVPLVTDDWQQSVDGDVYLMPTGIRIAGYERVIVLCESGSHCEYHLPQFEGVSFTYVPPYKIDGATIVRPSRSAIQPGYITCHVAGRDGCGTVNVVAREMASIAIPFDLRRDDVSRLIELLYLLVAELEKLIVRLQQSVFVAMH